MAAELGRCCVHGVENRPGQVNGSGPGLGQDHGASETAARHLYRAIDDPAAYINGPLYQRTGQPQPGNAASGWFHRAQP